MVLYATPDSNNFKRRGPTQQKKAAPGGKVDIYSLKASNIRGGEYKSYWMDCIKNMLDHVDLELVENVGYYSMINNFKLKPVNKASDMGNFPKDDQELYAVIFL